MTKKDRLEFVACWHVNEQEWCLTIIENGIKMAAPRFERLDGALDYAAEIITRRGGEIKNNSVTIMVTNVNNI